jgi:hypothetical protein
LIARRHRPAREAKTQSLPICTEQERARAA